MQGRAAEDVRPWKAEAPFFFLFFGGGGISSWDFRISSLGVQGRFFWVLGGGSLFWDVVGCGVVSCEVCDERGLACRLFLGKALSVAFYTIPAGDASKNNSKNNLISI